MMMIILTDPPSPPPPDNALGNFHFFNNAPHHAQISYRLFTSLYPMTKVLDFVLLLRLLPNGYYCFSHPAPHRHRMYVKFTKYPEKKENYENEITKYQNILCATIVLIDSRLWLNTQSKTMSMYYIVLYLL